MYWSKKSLRISDRQWWMWAVKFSQEFLHMLSFSKGQGNGQELAYFVFSIILPIYYSYKK